MQKFCLVTGSSRGIGRAIAVHLSKSNVGVVAVARSEEQLLETKRLGDSDNIHTVVADVACRNGQAKILQAVQSVCPGHLGFVVHNAGTLGSIGKVSTVDYDSWRQAFAVNVDGPLFLTQKLLPEMPAGGRILHIGSGAAHRPIDGWSAYCASKAAFHMLHASMQQELAAQSILVGSVLPGIVETEMQQMIRAASVAEMADFDYFVELKNNEYTGEAGKAHAPPSDGLDTAENVAHFVSFLLRGTSDEDYTAAEWDIRNTDHHGRWVA
jgi:NAD(P)-dependent dehydrogenase (short-subunit alcohol dehydrogenase family)